MKKQLIVSLLAVTMCFASARAEEVRITLGPEIAVSPVTDDVTVEGGVVTIRDKGSYVLSGTLEEGQIVVDAGGKDHVTLVLDGVSVTNRALPALMVENAGLTVISLATGTENTLSSGVPVDVLNTPADAEAEGGAVRARDDLTIEGEGSLTVGGYLNNGIQTSNKLSVLGGNITVEAVHHGVKGKDAVLIEGGVLNVTSGKDGVTSDDTTGEGYGVVTVRGGDLTIRAGGDGIQAETLLEISGGTLDITAGGGSEDVEYDVADDWGGWRGGGPNFGRGPWDDLGEEEDDGISTKGLKSGAALIISDGTITVDAADDAVHANGSVTITGGALTLSSGDDGIHADTSLTVEGGTITVLSSYEGMEANQILIAGGEMDITAADDGLNANGGEAFGMGFGGRGGRGFGGRGGFGDGQAERGATEDTPNLRITGGKLHVSAEGDGLDSNGNIVVEGGEIVVDGPSRGMNGAIDAGSENGGSCEVHGGLVLAIGAAGMADTFGEASTQCSFQLTLREIAAGEEIVITDSEGTELMRHTALKACASIVFSSPALALGETYTVTAGEQTAQITLSSVSNGNRTTRRGW